MNRLGEHVGDFAFFRPIPRTEAFGTMCVMFTDVCLSDEHKLASASSSQPCMNRLGEHAGVVQVLA